MLVSLSTVISNVKCPSGLTINNCHFSILDILIFSQGLIILPLTNKPMKQSTTKKLANELTNKQTHTENKTAEKRKKNGNSPQCDTFPCCSLKVVVLKWVLLYQEVVKWLLKRIYMHICIMKNALLQFCYR